MGEPGAFAKPLELFPGSCTWKITKGSRMQFDHRCPKAGGGLDLAGIRGNEQTDFNAGIRQPLNGGAQSACLTCRIQTAFGGQLLPTFRNQTDFVGLDLQGDRKDIRVIGHFQIQAGFNGFAQGEDITILNVATVFPQVNGDPRCPGDFTHSGSLNEIGIAGASSLTQCGHMIDIHPKSKFSCFHDVRS
eukprot:TRINITY_DN23207_c0_g1_i2.p2 TRINITY_DN23207_c0_g1~~TRINITY_DN23207_c0_g1_i2.p2  ORF type:complete len:189 (-),score=3.71 TRINITY_DN23207_c0_g1_i2:258-824(-)